jgi:hypothetical protein
MILYAWELYEGSSAKGLTYAGNLRALNKPRQLEKLFYHISNSWEFRNPLKFETGKPVSYNLLFMRVKGPGRIKSETGKPVLYNLLFMSV